MAQAETVYAATYHEAADVDRGLRRAHDPELF